MGLKLITPPQSEPIALDEAKEYLRIDDSEDTYVTSLIIGAREYCENFQNRAYINQQWELTLDDFETYEIIIPKPPLQSIDSIKYKDCAGIERVMQGTDYITDTDSYIGRIMPPYGRPWPIFVPYPANAVRVRFTCGYGDAPKVPQRVKQAMLLLISHWYENRLPASKVAGEMDFAVTALLSQDRIIPV